MNSLDLKLASAQGSSTLRDHLGPKGVVVYFLRDFGCHTCVNHAAELGQAAAEIKAAGFGLVAVGHGSASEGEKVRNRKALPFPVLADPQHDAFDAFNLGKVLGYWQKSGVFVLDGEGNRTFGEPSTSPKAGLDLPVLLAALKGA